MWIILSDIQTEYVINLDSYQYFRRGQLCDKEPTIILFSSTGNDLMLMYANDGDRDFAYQTLLMTVNVDNGYKCKTCGLTLLEDEKVICEICEENLNDR